MTGPRRPLELDEIALVVAVGVRVAAAQLATDPLHVGQSDFDRVRELIRAPWPVPCASTLTRRVQGEFGVSWAWPTIVAVAPACADAR